MKTNRYNNPALDRLSGGGRLAETTANNVYTPYTGWVRKRLLTAILVVMGMIGFGVVNTKASTDSTFRGHYTPGGFFDTVFDMQGNKYALGQIAVNDTVRMAARGDHSLVSLMPASCSSGYFQIYLEPGCGLDGVGSPDVDRLAVLCKVLHDVSYFINSPLWTTGQKINIWVRNATTLIGEGLISPYFAAFASSFYTVPYSTAKSGIADNTVWITLNSGIDAYSGITPVLTGSGSAESTIGTYFHGIIGINFTDGLINWHTDLSSSPALGETDLYSVLLHEVTHALGFMTEINYGGLSNLGTGYQYFTRYDQFLQTAASAGMHLITNTGGCNMYQWSFNSTLSPFAVLSPGGTSTSCPAGYQTGTPTDNTVCTNALYYVGGSATVPVYTPYCFEKGSSLSHFEDQCYIGFPAGFCSGCTSTNNQYFLMADEVVLGPYSPTTNPGAMKRYPTPEERSVLCDIGYSVNTSFDTHPYVGSSICPGLGVVGIIDGINSSGGYTYYSTGGAISITLASLLSNDYGVVGGSVSCIEIVNGSGSLAIGSTTATYTPSIGELGDVLLRYIPVNASGVAGNITYVYLFIGETPCTPSTCNMVLNSDFESTYTPIIDCGNLSYLHCWSVYMHSPDLLTRSTTCSSTSAGLPNGLGGLTPLDDVDPLSTFPNNHVIGLYSLHASEISEGVQTVLSSPLVPGNSYIIKFRAKLAGHFPGDYYHPSTLVFATSNSTTPLVPVSGYGVTSASFFATGLNNLYDFNILTPLYETWESYTSPPITYTATTADKLLIINAGWFDPYGFESYIMIDDVSIMPVSSSCSFEIPPSSICQYEPSFDLSSYITCPLGGTFTWQTTPVPSICSCSTFDPLVAYNATGVTSGPVDVEVCYNYTNSIGCANQVCSEVHIGIGEITGLNALCVGSTITLYNATTGGTWSSSNTAIATIDAITGIVMGLSVGTVTIYYSLPGGCITSYTVSVYAYIAPITGYSYTTLGCHTTLADATIGGAWSSSDYTLAWIDAPGDTYGEMVGTATITYARGGCYVTFPFTVLDVSPITGPTTAAIGCNITLTEATAGGTWSSSNTAMATVSATGVVSGLAPGVVTISYTWYSGCVLTYLVTITPALAPITGAMATYLGCNLLLYDATAGGTWSSSNTAVAIVSASGVVTGVTAGSATITYTLYSGCYVTYPIVINPHIVSISGPLSVHAGCIISLSDATTGGMWSSSNTAIATITPVSGILTAITSGSVTIYYSIGGCSVQVIIHVSAPIAAITGSPTTICAGNTTTLHDATGGGTWSSSNHLIATVSSTGVVTGVAEGTVTITYSLGAGSGCFVTKLITIMPVFTFCCGPCLMPTGCGGAYTSILTPTLSTNLPAGNYKLDEDLTITGLVTLTDAVIRIAPGVHIYIASTAHVTLKGCHLFSCAGMWAGFKLMTGGTNTGVLTLTENTGTSTLIEDATVAVDINSPATPASGLYFLTCNNVIFNRNAIGIRIANYTPTAFVAATTGSYPYQIENTVMTSRNFCSYSAHGCPYPYTWPNTTGTYGLKTDWTPPNAFAAPYNIASPTAGGTGVAYPYSDCHTPGTTYGIYLQNVGSYIASTNSYNSVVVGAAATGTATATITNKEYNLFDTLCFGIYAQDASLTVINSGFAHIKQAIPNTTDPASGGDGIYALKDNTKKYQLTVMPGIHAWYNHGVLQYKSPNFFYNCQFGVYAKNYDAITGSQNVMMTTQDNLIGSDGFRGYYFETSQLDYYLVNYNKIYNVANGIELKMASSIPIGLPLNPGPGQVSFNFNTIQATFSTAPFVAPPPPTPSPYIHHAIWVDNTISYYGTPGSPFPTTQVNVDNNYINNAYDGIYVNGIVAQKLTTNGDTVITMDEPAVTCAWGEDRFGIYHTDCFNDETRMNIVTNTGNGTVSCGGGFGPLIYYVGVKIAYSSEHRVSCNQLNGMGNAFVFEATNSNCTWRDNVMTQNPLFLGFAFVLDNAEIGQQGDIGNPYDNTWIGYDGTAGGGNGFQTFTANGSNPLLSTLYVSPSSTTDPTTDPINNMNFDINYSLIYGYVGGSITGNGNGLVVTTADGTHTDAECSSGTTGTMGAGGNALLSKIAKKNDTVSIYKPHHHWIAQHNLYQVMTINDTLGDTSAVLTSFKATAPTSRYGLMTTIEQKLAAGNADTAQYLLTSYALDSLVNTNMDTTTGVLMADAIEADTVVNSHRIYYQLYINYLHNALSTADSAQIEWLAKECPFTHGAAVYKARALYDIVYKTTRLFNYNCSSVDTSSMRRTVGKNTSNSKEIVNGQQYKLLPNPNNGSFTLMQNIINNQTNRVEIWNSTGIKVYSNFIDFNSGISSVNFSNHIPGLYLLKITDNNGNSFTLKFVIE